MKTVLVVEDEELVRSLVKAILAGREEYEVLCADSAAEGIQIGAEFPNTIHLLLSDVMLENGRLGTEVAAKIKCARPEMRVILMSGKDGGELLVLSTGWKFLQKPFVGAQLLELIQGLLGEHASAAG